MRKIIILPEFASSHFLKCSLPNWISTLEPDIIIINSGIFPGGIENKKEIDDEFGKKWCHPEIDCVGFDNDETYEFCKQFSNVFLFKINHSQKDVNLAFLDSITSGLESFSIKPSDIIFPLEPDVLFHQDDKEKIAKLISQLKTGEGIQCIWKDFLQTQFYVEAINESNPKWRRFCYCFDTMENYRSAMDAFMSQNYSKLKKTTEFIAFHYPWWNPGKYRQLRYDLIWRNDPNYWKRFEEGLQEIQAESEDYVSGKLEGNPAKQIIIRPSRNDEARWAKFIDISHPIHIQNHPNFVK